MPLTRNEARFHQKALDVLEQDVLTFEDKQFVFENYHEAGGGDSTSLSAFFTPMDLAWDLRFEVHGPQILDLCAGIGVLSFCYYHGFTWDPAKQPRITCVEKNPRYCEVGRKLLPEAEWICGDIADPDVQDRLKAIGPFDTVLSNPPFGRTAMKKKGWAPRYQGADFEYAALDVASDLADHAVFLIPQSSAPFRFSGARYCVDYKSPRDAHEPGNTLRKVRPFEEATGIELTVGGVGIDTGYHAGDWRRSAPPVEIVVADFMDARERRGDDPIIAANPEPETVPAFAARLPVQLDLFPEAA